MASKQQSRRPAWILPIHRASFYEQLGRQLKSGLPAATGLRNMAREKAPEAIALAVADARDRIEHGGTLAEALARHPNAFPAHDVGFLRAAELAGSLPAACQQLAGEYRARQARAMELGWKLIYPAALLFLAVVLLPLPLAVREGMGAYLRQAVPGVVLYGGAIALALRLAFAPGAAASRAKLTRACRGIPWIGTQLHQLALARTVRLLAACVAAGLPATECFHAAERATSDPELSAACAAVARRLQGGRSIAAAMAASGDAFPAELRQVVSAGEESGKLDEALAAAAEDWEARGFVVLGLLFGLARWTVMAFVGAYVSWGIIAEVAVHVHDVNSMLQD